MKFFKKNQLVIYVIALMLVVAGYLNYTTTDPAQSIITNANIEEAKNSNIGDAQLVSSNDVQNDLNKQSNTTNENEIINNGEGQNNIESQTNEEIKNSETSQNVNNANTTNATNTTNTEASIASSNITSEETNENTSKEVNANTSDDSYFTNSKLERESMYSQMIETYEKVLNSANALEVQKQSATDEIAKINNTKNSIMICENLIGTKGFDKNVVFVNGDSVTVIIGATELKEEDVAQIQNIVSRELKAAVENIHISIK